MRALLPFWRWLGVAAALVLSFAGCVAAEPQVAVVDQSARQAIVLTLSPDMPAAPAATAPALHQPAPDGNVVPTGAALAPATPFRWIAPLNADPAKPTKLALSLRSDASVAQRVTLGVWDWRNRQVLERTWTTPMAAEISLEITGRGVYLLTLDGWRGDQHVFRLPRSVGALRGAAEMADAQRFFRDGAFFVGVCAFPGRYHWGAPARPVKPEGLSEDQARALEAELAAGLGAGVARLDVSSVMQPDRTDFTRMDASVQAYTSRGFKLALQLMNPPDWCIDPRYQGVAEDRWKYPREEAHVRRYTRELAERYGQHALFAQVNNEPDTAEFWRGTEDEYLRTYAWAAQELTLARPGLPVVNGGYCLVQPEKTKRYVEGLKGKTAYVAYHAHGDWAGLKRTFANIAPLHANAGYEKLVYVNTETGYAGWRLDQERKQAAAMAQKTLWTWAAGHRGALLFCMRMTDGPARGGRDFGMLDHYFCPRFAYGSTQAFLELYAGASFSQTLLDEPDLCVMRFDVQPGRDREGAEDHGLAIPKQPLPDGRGSAGKPQAKPRTLLAVFAPQARKQVVIEIDSAGPVSQRDGMGNTVKTWPGAVRRKIAVDADAIPQTLVVEDCRWASLAR